MGMNVGLSAANGLYQEALAGTFKMAPDAARNCADIYSRFAEGVDDQIDDSKRLHALSGFGTFESAMQLQKGFETKGVALTDALWGIKEAALRMSAAYLRAGGLLSEADAMNQRAINTAANSGGDR